MKLTTQEKKLIEEVITEVTEKESCDKTTEMVVLSILNKIKEDGN